MVKIDSAVAESELMSEQPVTYAMGYNAARRINDGWKKDDYVALASDAAFEYGLLVSARMLPQDRAEIMLDWHFKHRNVDEKYWSSVYQSFLNGRDTGMTYAELRERMTPVAANDNVAMFEPTVFEWEDPTKLPVRDWIYGKHLIRRHVSATIASGAVGKTSLKIVEALALATGRPLLGQDVPKKCRVWLFNLEDDLIELRRRVSAAMIHYKIKPEDIGDRLHIDGEKSLVITTTTRQGTVINAPVVDAVVEAIVALEIDVLFVDPFISSHDAPESDSGAMDLVMKSGWVRVAREGNCAVELCHHTTKADSSSGMATAMSGRGSGAVVFACRSVQVLNPMSHEDAKLAALESPVGYFSAKDDKQNLTLKTGGRDWYKMESVSLGNGGTGNLSCLRSDSIGVVTLWQWPTDKSFVEDVTADQLRAIKNLLKIGEHRKDVQSNDWAGNVVAEILGIDLANKTEKARAVKMIEAWIKEGHLEVYKKNDENRRLRDFIRTP